MTVSNGDDGRIILYCHAGCKIDDIIRTIGLKWSDIQPSKETNNTNKNCFDWKHIVAKYNYPNGTRKLRDQNKNFCWQHLTEDGWKAGRPKNIPHILYEAGNPQETVFVVEGEKDADNLSKLGFFCVSPENGASEEIKDGGKWFKSYTERLTEKSVIIIPDNDDIGKKYMDSVASELKPAVSSLKVLDLKRIFPEIQNKGDISNMLDAYGQERTKNLLLDLISVTDEWTDKQTDFKQLGECKQNHPDIVHITNYLNTVSLETDNRGNPLKTIENFYRIFSDDQYYSSVRFNELTNSAEISITGNDGSTIIKQMDDTADADSMRYIQTKYHLYHPNMHDAGMKLLLRDRAYNPIVSLVDSFQWDGKNRIELFLNTWMKVEDSAYSREVSRLIFAGGINRLYSPGCKFDDVPVLVGTKQGEGKSTIIEWLALNSAYSKVIDQMDGSQKAVEGLTGVWIGEIAELSAFRKADIEALKSFITRTSDQYRQPYARKVSVLPRRCVFIGTTNSRQFLTDKTGNRRFFPVEVHSNGYILWQKEDEIRQYIVQCWAEARERYKKGEMLPYAQKDLIDNYREAQEAAEIDDWRPGVIEQYLNSLPDNYCVCLKELYKRALYPDSVTEPKRTDQLELAQIMDKMPQWERTSKRVQTTEYGRQRCWQKTKSVHDENEIDSVEKLPF